MKTKNKSLLGLCCFLLVTFAACEAREPATPSPYPVYDSGMWAAPTFPQIHWIDNDRVLFKTIPDNDKRRVSTGPFNLSIWEISKGVKPYTQFVKGVYACVRDGNIYYVLEDEQKNMKRFYGPFGKEKPFEFPKTKGTFFDEMNCRPNDNPEIVAKRQNNRALRLLLAQHGYLDLGPSLGKDSSTNTPITLYRPGQPKSIVLSHRRQEIGSDPEYYAFKDAYFIQRIVPYQLNNLEGHKNDPAVAWWLYPDGNVKKIQIPFGPWGMHSKFYPTRKGIVITSRNWQHPNSAGKAGIYLFSSARIEKVIDGVIDGPQVSPDGCKIAFSHVPYLLADSKVNDPNRRTLKIINFCPEEKSHAQ